MNVFSRLFDYVREKKWAMILSLLLSAVATILSFLPYFFFYRLLKEITGDANPERIRLISYQIFGFTLLYSIAYMGSLLFSHLFAFRLETNMKKRGLHHLLNGSFSFFDVNPSGRTRKIIDDNTGNTHTIVAHMLPDSVNAILFPIGVLILSFSADWRIGLLMIAAIIVAILCFKFMSTGEDEMKKYLTSLERINSETVEYVRGIQVIKVFGLSLESFEKLHAAIQNYSKVISRQCEMCRQPWVFYQAVMMSFGAFIILIAQPMLAANQSVASVVSLVVFFMTFSGMLSSAFMKVMFFSKNYGFANDAINKLENLFCDMEKNKLTEGSVDKLQGTDISFENVTFEYQKDVPVLERFSLYLEGGRRYALVGSSGGGKSTIAKLISGFYPVKEGVIKIGGVDIKNYQNSVLEKNIAFVFQHAKLFKTSLYENVKIGNPTATHDEVMKALELAQCNEILDKFPEREKTVIGATGVNLSGGEIQRIAIARAILKDAPIIILDEASAASDPENEYEMQQAFSHLMAGKTVIMIAHRLTSIRNVDEVLVIENGQVIERGSHEALMAQNGKYKASQDLFQHANEWRLTNEI